MYGKPHIRLTLPIIIQPNHFIYTGLINTKCLTTKVVWIGWVLQFVKMRMGGMIGVLW